MLQSIVENNKKSDLISKKSTENYPNKTKDVPDKNSAILWSIFYRISGNLSNSKTDIFALSFLRSSTKSYSKSRETGFRVVSTCFGCFDTVFLLVLGEDAFFTLL